MNEKANIEANGLIEMYLKEIWGCTIKEIESNLGFMTSIYLEAARCAINDVSNTLKQFDLQILHFSEHPNGDFFVKMIQMQQSFSQEVKQILESKLK